MHINVPLLPALGRDPADGPYGPCGFRSGLSCSLWSWRGCFSLLVTELRRQGQAMSYHAEQSVLVTMNRSPTNDPIPLANWHAARSQEYRARRRTT